MVLVRLSGMLNGFTHKSVGLYGVVRGFLRIASRKLLSGFLVMHRRVVAARRRGGVVLRCFRYVFQLLLHL